MISIQTLIVLVILLLYVPIGRFYRIGQDAKTLIKTKYDRGSARLAGFAYLSSLFAIGLGVVLTYRNVAAFENRWVSWIGVVMTFTGFLIRLLAVFALGRFYTRAIRITPHHKIVTSGIYKHIRHPGYLGVLLIFVGAALAISNWVSLISICLILPASLLHRIRAEEMMMMDHFGEEYRVYRKNTPPFIPRWRKQHRHRVQDHYCQEKPGITLREG